MSSTTEILKNINFMSEERYDNLSEVKDDELYAVKIEGGAGGGTPPDDLSITKNSNDKLQTVGVINQSNTTSAIKVWTGTKAQYDLLTPDSNTIYNITDEDVSPDNRVTHNIGDIFYSLRTEDILNGAVVCDGSTYNIFDYASGDQSVRNLLINGKLPYVSLDVYSATITSKGVCRCFGYDANGETFRVPTLSDVFIETGTASSANEFIDAGLPNITGSLHIAAYGGQYLEAYGSVIDATGAFTKSENVTGATDATDGYGNKSAHFAYLDASRSSSIYGNSSTVQPNAVKYRAYVQLATDTSDSALQTVSSVLSDVAELQDQMEETINYGNVTNCITEIPQDIKLELNSGVLTLKAGSKVYVPNGFELDGTTPKFDVVTISTDMSNNTTGASQMFMTYCNGTLKYLFAGFMNGGTVATRPNNPEAYALYYITSTNTIEEYNNGAWHSGYSLPIGIATRTSTNFSSIDQVFNGFGYIGSTVFALPGVRGLIPNGRNEDGSLKNISFEVSNVVTDTYDSTISMTLRKVWIDSTGQIKGLSGDIAYHEDINKVLYNVDNTQRLYCNSGIISISAGKITSLTLKTPFHALDWNDKSIVSGWGMPGGKYTNLTVGTSVASYVAPANGWFCVGGYSTAVGGYVDLASDTNFTEYTFQGWGQSHWGRGFIPVVKGTTVRLGYSSFTFSYFRFVYTESEVN